MKTPIAVHHAEDCQFEQCRYCSCCAHGMPVSTECRVDDAPAGMSCPEWGCGCEGKR